MKIEFRAVHFRKNDAPARSRDVIQPERSIKWHMVLYQKQAFANRAGPDYFFNSALSASGSVLP